MRAVFLLALLAAVSTIGAQEIPERTLLDFPDGSLPELGPRRTAVRDATAGQTKASDCPASCPAFQRPEESDPKWRLSTDVLPSHYNLNLDVDVDNFKYSGVVEITIKPKVTVEQVTLHNNGLHIGKTDITYLRLGLDYWPVAWGDVLSVTEDKELTTVTFHLSKPLDAGYTYKIKIEFDGEIRKELYGLYRSSYKVGSETRWLATTQFEPTNARKAFPCFDEPNMKATFAISITNDNKYSALSNMPVKLRTSKAGKITTTFQQTPVMSVYLIAFIISDFESYRTNDPISSIYAAKKLIKDAAYAQKAGVDTVRAMEDFTKIRFALPKIDHVAIPDFGAGAMENWGLITYRDYMLILTNDSTTPIKQTITSVIAHEVGHQWTGNLVTLDWWSFTWLNEGFATFFEYYITEVVTKGRYAMWDQFIPGKFQVALDLDGNPATSVAMSSKASTPNEISNKFDQISYGKGGCILRMFSELLTLDKFRDGLRAYLGKRKYATAHPDDLFAEWEKVSGGVMPKGVKFSDFAIGWTEQDGAPIVTAFRNYETNETTFTQERYYDVKPTCKCDYNRRWWIPLTWITEADKSNQDKFKPQAWLTGNVTDEKLVVKINQKTGEWLLLNPRSVGYYRVNYDTRNWLLLSRSLAEDPTKFPLQNKAQIINDAFSLASSGRLDFTVALGTMSFLQRERGPFVWQSAIRLITKMYDNVGPTAANQLFEDFWQKMMTDVYYTVGLSVNVNGDHGQNMLRYYLATWSCLFGVEQCMKDAQGNLDRYNKDPSSLHPDVVTATFCGAVKAADEDTFWKIRKLASSAKRADVRQALPLALGRCHPDDKLVKKHMEEALKADSMLPKDLRMISIQQVLISPSKFSVSFDFIKDNLDKILSVFSKDTGTELVKVFIRRIRTESQYKQVATWLNANKNKLSNPDKVAEEFKKARANTRWNKLYLSSIADWLAAALGREPPSDIPPPPPPNPNPDDPDDSDDDSAVFVKAAPLLILGSFVLSLIN